MIDTNVKLILIRIYGNEGGYSNRKPKDDPGGETKWGISKRSYPDLDIKNLTLEQAAEIYVRDFIRPFMDKGFHKGIVFQMVDFAVHSGVEQATKCLQRELGLKDDGIIGPKTKSKINMTSNSDLVMSILAARIDFLVNLKNWSSNSRGWARRIANNLRYGVIDT